MARNTQQQGGEDGVIAQVFRRFGTTNKIAVEFGCENAQEVVSVPPPLPLSKLAPVWVGGWVGGWAGGCGCGCGCGWVLVPHACSLLLLSPRVVSLNFIVHP